MILLIDFDDTIFHTSRHVRDTYAPLKSNEFPRLDVSSAEFLYTAKKNGFEVFLVSAAKDEWVFKAKFFAYTYF